MIKKTATGKTAKPDIATSKTKPATEPKDVKGAKQAGPAVSAKSEKPAKPVKQKMVRDSFTMPEEDYSRLDALKARCLESGMEIKKSELLRAGLIALSKLAPASLLKAVSEVEKIKTGRPKGK
jgi:hypothetical protein